MEMALSIEQLATYPARPAPCSEVGQPILSVSLHGKYDMIHIGGP